MEKKEGSIDYYKSAHCAYGMLYMVVGHLELLRGERLMHSVTHNRIQEIIDEIEEYMEKYKLEE